MARPLHLASAVLAAGVILTAQNEQRPPVFRSGTEIYEFEVTVLDRNREPIRGLTLENFSLSEGGKPLRIAQFTEIEFPEFDGPRTTDQEIAAPDMTSDRYADRRLFAIVLDDFGLAAGPGAMGQSAIVVPDVKDAARGLIRSLGPKDFAAVMLTMDPRPYPDFTNMWSKLSGAIDQFRVPSDVEAYSLLRATGGRVGLTATIRGAIGYMSKFPQHSKTIVYIGHPPPVDFARRQLSMFADRVEDVISDARAAGIPIFGLDVTGPLDRSATGLLLPLAENTGGRAYGRGNLDLGISRVFAETRSYYLLGFEPLGPADGKFHRVEVKVNRPNVDVRAPTGYRSPSKPDMVKPDAPAFDPVLDAALKMTAPAEGRKLFGYATASPGRVSVVAEIESAEAGAKVWAGGADVEVDITSGSSAVGRATGRIEPGARGALVDVPVPDASGSLRANVHVRASGTALEDSSEVRAGGQRLGAARVFRATSLPRAPLGPVAEFTFRRTERLRVEWPELDALDRRQVRLLRRTGEPVGPLPSTSGTDVSGKPLLVVTFPLSNVAAGEYLIEAVVGQGAATDRQLVAFRVIQ